MKSLRSLVLSMAILSVPVSALAGAKIALGVQGGLTFPNYQFKNTSPAAQYGNKDGWLGGFFGEIGFSSLTLRPELNYVTKTYTVAGIADVKNHYLEIPVFLKFNPLGDFVVSPFVLVGPQWSKQIRTEVTTVGSTTTFTNTADDWDLAAVAGLGVEFNILPIVVFSVQGRYAYGFRDIDRSSVEMKTRAFYALAGLAFAL